MMQPICFLCGKEISPLEDLFVCQLLVKDRAAIMHEECMKILVLDDAGRRQEEQRANTQRS